MIIQTTIGECLRIVSKVFTAILIKTIHGLKRKIKLAKNRQGSVWDIQQLITHSLVSMVKSRLNSRRGGKVYVAFVDYKKTFDTVNRDTL